MTDPYVEEIGAGLRVILVHGSGSGARTRSWSSQFVLADRHQLVIPRPPVCGRSPAAEPSFERDTVDIAELLGHSAHLVCHSYAQAPRSRWRPEVELVAMWAAGRADSSAHCSHE